jgi:hypothetical protein
MEIKDLKGKFHAHITVLAKSLAVLEAKAKANKAKTTVIYLQKGDSFQTDVMVTKYFFIKDDEDKTVFDFLEDLKEIAADIESGGMKVLRTKIEHESLPTLLPSKDHYWEMHFKCLIPFEDLEDIKAGIQESIPGMVPSTNVFSKKEQKAVQFFNMRVYEGTEEQAMETFERLQSVLSTVMLCFHGELIESKREVIVYDSNHSHDEWWA